MRYLIIGLGIYGENLARDLADMGHEVIGADIKQTHVEAVKDYISTVYIIDSTEESALSVLPLDNVDLVIVAIGENFGASIRTVALLKKAGVKHIFARAIDKLHESILESFEIDRILTPEQRAAADLTHEMELGADIESLSVDADNVVVKFKAPQFLLGLRYAEIDFQARYDLEFVAATRPLMRRNVLGIERPAQELLNLAADDSITVAENDVLTVFGTRKRLQRFLEGKS